MEVLTGVNTTDTVHNVTFFGFEICDLCFLVAKFVERHYSSLE